MKTRIIQYELNFGKPPSDSRLQTKLSDCLNVTEISACTVISFPDVVERRQVEAKREIIVGILDRINHLTT